MDQIQAMRIFTRVVEAGTFTRAADSLSLPKATVTKHVQALEARPRVTLLNRPTRRVTVTAMAPPITSAPCGCWRTLTTSRPA